MPAEIELKLLLPGASPATVLEQLGHCPALATAQAKEQWLLNRYYDTPDQLLRQQRAALRLRQISPQPLSTQQTSAGKRMLAQEQWWQTFKTAGVSHGGLSQRGEWEARVANGELDAAALRTTPWATLDPEDHLLAQLSPCFETRCHRTTWHLQPSPGCAIEVALDIGEISAAGLTQPMLELELELLSGPPQALFELAQQLGEHVALLPCDVSKAERGYALAQGLANQPTRARPTRLRANSQPLPAAADVLSEMFDQLTRNLAALQQSDDPELVHQARVAWRRWSSACRLFRPWLPPPPDRQALRPLFEALGRLRDLDVARLDTLPHWTPHFVQADDQRQALVDAATQQLHSAAAQQRQQVRQSLCDPHTSPTWLAHAHWLLQLHTQATPTHSGHKHWARQRMHKLQRRLQQTLAQAQTPQDAAQTQHLWHQTRLQAKRVRYAQDALQDLLPKQRGKHWAQDAAALQQRLGQWRDADMAATLLAHTGAAPAWTAFMQGVACALHPSTR